MLRSRQRPQHRRKAGRVAPIKERPHHPKRIVAFAATHPDSRAATVAPHGTPAFEYQSGPETLAARPTQRHRTAPPEAGRATRGKATRSEFDRRVPASGGAMKIHYAISAPQGRLHPVAILFAPKKKSRRRSASRPKRDAPPGAGQGVDGLRRSVSNRQRPQSRISPCPSPRWRYEAATRAWRSYSTPKRAYPCPRAGPCRSSILEAYPGARRIATQTEDLKEGGGNYFVSKHQTLCGITSLLRNFYLKINRRAINRNSFCHAG